MMGPIPAEYFWPGFCATLLALSVGSAVATVVAAQSDGGAEVVGSYGLELDRRRALRDQRRENRALGWEVFVEIPEGAGPGESTDVRIRVVDRKGVPLEGLEGRVRLYSPALADPVDGAELASITGRPGEYRAGLEFERRGIWDFAVRVRADGDDFEARVRGEL